MRITIFILLAGFVLGVSAGCSEYEYNRRTMRFERVGPRPRPQVASGTQETAANSEADSENEPEIGQVPPPATRAPANMSTKQRRSFAKGEIYRLYIGDESSKETLSPQNLYLVKQTSPEKLAELLVMLYPAEGPGGSKRLSFLLYSNQEIWDRAKAMAPRLDVAPQQTESGKLSLNKGLTPWDQAIGLIYGSDFPRQMDSDVRFRVTNLLNQIIKDPAEKTELRWAAGVIAGTLQTRFNPKDYVAAKALLSQAGNFARGRDFKALVIRYHYIRQLAARGQDLAAQKQAQDALNEFQTWENTYCYQSIRRMMEQKQQPKLRK